MKSTETTQRWKNGTRIGLAGLVAAGLLATMGLPAVAAETDPTAPSPSYAEQVLASNGDNAIDPVLGKFYRIPALADLGNGVVLASYDGRPDGADAPSANSIVQRRSTDGGVTWGAPTLRAARWAPGQLQDTVLATPAT